MDETELARLTAIENRVTEVETDLQKLRRTVHNIAEDAMKTTARLINIEKKTDKVITFFEGTDKIFGFCRAHWRTLLKFGCGFVTAYGVTNPHVAQTANFISRFFGL